MSWLERAINGATPHGLDVWMFMNDFDFNIEVGVVLSPIVIPAKPGVCPVAYVRQWLAESEDSGAWGSLLSSAFAIADAITLLAGTVPPELDYRPSPMLRRSSADDQRASAELLALVENPASIAMPGYPVITVQTLEAVASVLNAELDAIPASDRY